MFRLRACNRILRKSSSIFSPSAMRPSSTTPRSHDQWIEAAKDITWTKPYTKLLDESESPFNRWFHGGQLNTCYNCVDKHVEDGFGTQPAIVYLSPHSSIQDCWSYDRLHSAVWKFAEVLKSKGVSKGDRVIVYMPNSPQAIIAMLACARIGAVHCVVFGGFASNELAIRIKDCTPKVVVYSSCGIDGNKVIPYQQNVNAALEIAAADGHRVSSCIVYQRAEYPEVAAVMDSAGRDCDWAAEMDKHALPLQVTAASRGGINRTFEETELNVAPTNDCVSVESSDPLYILYTSGTTGQPKGVLRDNGGHAVALKWCMSNVHGVYPGDVWWAASDVGWVVGHSFSVYGPLLQRLTTVLYEGKPVGTPDAGAFWKIISEYKVNVLMTAPTALRAIKKVDPEGEMVAPYAMDSLRTVFLVGERSDPASIQWAENHLKVPIRDHWWQTESGWAICSNMVGLDGYLPVKYGSSFGPVKGYDLRVFDYEDGTKEITEPSTVGRLALKLPMPPGFMISLYNNKDRFVKSYMTSIPGYYDTGDAGMVDEDGYVSIMTRTDDVINVAGHRLSTGAMEEILCDHPDIAEAAVIGIKNDLRGQVPLGLFVINSKVSSSPEHKLKVVEEVKAMVRERIGAVAFFKDAVCVERLPKTRSGKILRTTLRSIANGTKDYKVPATIEDMTVLKEVEEVIMKHMQLN